MVGYAGMTYGAEEDRIEASQLVESIRRQHRAVFQIGLAAPFELVPLQRKAEPPRGGLEYTDSFRDDFFADAVPRNHRDAVRFHRAATRAHTHSSYWRSAQHILRTERGSSSKLKR